MIDTIWHIDQYLENTNDVVSLARLWTTSFACLKAQLYHTLHDCSK